MMTSAVRPTSRAGSRAAGGIAAWPWVLLLLLLAAPVLITSLGKDIGAVAYDAATEHIHRGVAFSRVIDDRLLYPRWTQDLHWGLGSPLFTFQPPLPYYGMDLLARLGLSHPLGWRILVALGFALAFLGAYLLVKELTGKRWSALTAAVAYLYAPYVLRNALERGSNEAYSMFLYPLVLWSLLALARRPSYGRFVLATAFWAACIGSHVLGPLMLAPFAGLLAVWVLWRYRTPAPLLALLAGGLLTAFIWVPMSLPNGGEQQWVHVERDFTQPDAIPVNNPIPLDQLLAPPAIFDMARDNNNVGDRIGLAHTLLLLAGIPAAIYAWRRNRRVAIALLIALGAGWGLLFLFTPWSDWVWRLGGSVMAKLLYRTRLMGVQALAAATVIGLIVAALPQRWQRGAAVLAAALLILIATPSLYVELQHQYAEFRLPVDVAQVREMEIKSGGSALTAFGEFTPLARTDPFDEQTLAELGGPGFSAADNPVRSEDVTVLAADVRTQAWDLEVTAAAPTTATLHLLYYPRWRAFLDGNPVATSYESGSGLTQIALPAGQHRLSLRYETTAAERVGLLISGGTLLALLAAAAWALLGRRRVEAGSAAQPADTDPTGSAERGVPVWSVAVLAALLALKFLVLDPQTTLFRCASGEAFICGAQNVTRAAFVDAPQLRGYSVESYEVRPGEDLRFDLYWQGIPGEPRTLASFVHVRASQPDQLPNPRAENGMWAQIERIAPGGLLTQEFQARKLYKDTYRLAVPGDIPPGQYYFEIGWFDPETGEQVDILSEAISPDLRILWRSVLLPDIRVLP
jgi:hypothetical protein